MEGRTGDALFQSNEVSYPSLSTPHDNGLHAVLVATGEAFTIGDRLMEKYLQYSSQILGVKRGMIDNNNNNGYF